MEVRNLLIQELILPESAGAVVSKTFQYGFREDTWVSPYTRTRGNKVGPITIIHDLAPDFDASHITMTEFPPRRLPTEGNPGKLTSSLSETWTQPDWTLYALVLPRGFVAVSIEIKIVPYDDWTPADHLAVTEGDQLFYWAVINGGDRNRFQVKALVKQDEVAALAARGNAGIIKSGNDFKEIGRKFRAFASNPAVLLKLLEMAGRALMKHGSGV